MNTLWDLKQAPKGSGVYALYASYNESEQPTSREPQRDESEDENAHVVHSRLVQDEEKPR